MNPTAVNYHGDVQSRLAAAAVARSAGSASRSAARCEAAVIQPGKTRSQVRTSRFAQAVE
eukprot:6213749-Pleurochrysis_carterae.AAC.4